MIKSNASPVLHRHFITWFVALFVFAFFEWRHTGFVSYVFPFPTLAFLPGALLLARLLFPSYRKKEL